MQNWRLLSGLLLTLLFLGCESSDQTGNFWSEADNGDAQAASSDKPEKTEEPSSDTSTATTAGDEVAFSSFHFNYGNFNGSSAKRSAPSIANLKISGGRMSYSWAGATLSAWGLGNSEAGAICCFFVKNSAGSWVGGKFDWISTSRTSRSLKHITGGYGGWTLAGVPNPCDVAFVIISANGKQRSNVIASKWQR